LRCKQLLLSGSLKKILLLLSCKGFFREVELGIFTSRIFCCEQIQANFQAIESIAYSTKELEIERDKLYAEMESISQLMEQAIQNNASVALDQEKYNREFDEMAERFNSVKEKYDAINEKIETRKSGIFKPAIIKTLLTEDETTTFSPLLWQSLFDYAKVSRDGKITFVFRNGDGDLGFSSFASKPR